jgi:hypothetical protein
MGKTKQNGVLHRLRRGIMCDALSCALALGMMLTMPGMGMTTRAADYFEDKGIKYLCDNNSLTAKVAYGVDKNRSEVYIPATIEYKGQKYKVVEITERAFWEFTNIKKIILEEGIEVINGIAFADSGIKEIEIPASVNKIGDMILSGCNITKIRFKGTIPPTSVDEDWLKNAANNNIIIEIPEGAEESVWKSALKLEKYNYNFIIQTYDPTVSSNPSSTTTSPNQEKNSDGEVEFIEEEPVNHIPEHVCQYEWEVVREVGADQDGLEQYLCKLCGNVQSTLTIPASQHQVQELYTKVTGAAEGETVTYDTGLVHTVCDKLFTKLQQRKDVTLIITYQYKGENYRTTFPAGADYTELMQDADQFYGMLGLNGRCGIVTEKN